MSVRIDEFEKKAIEICNDPDFAVDDPKVNQTLLDNRIWGFIQGALYVERHPTAPATTEETKDENLV